MHNIGQIDIFTSKHLLSAMIINILSYFTTKINPYDMRNVSVSFNQLVISDGIAGLAADGSFVTLDWWSTNMTKLEKLYPQLMIYS